MRSTAILVSVIVIAAGLLSGCGGTPSPALPSGMTAIPTTTTDPSGDIVIARFAYFVRGPLKPGQQVTVINDDEASHSVATDAGDAFDVRVSGGGGVETFTAPATPGTYEFHCKYHAGMHGSLTVQ